MSSSESGLFEPVIPPELEPLDGEEFSDLRLWDAATLEREERRRGGRAALVVPVLVECRDSSGNLTFSAEAKLRNFSMDGAFLEGIEPGRMPYSVWGGKREFLVLGGELEGMRAEFEPVREAEDGSGMGVALIGGFTFPVQ